MKNYFYVFCFLLLCILFPINVKASCTNSDLAQLKTLSKKIEIGYEFSEESKAFSLKAYNLNPNFYLDVDNMYFFYQGESAELGSFIDNAKFKIVVYGSAISKCYDEKIDIINVRLPYYNKYSEYKECLDKQNLDICKKWYNTSRISEEVFLKQVKDKKDNNKKSFFENLKQFLMNYWIYVVASVVVVTITIVVIIKIRKKNNQYS